MRQSAPVDRAPPAQAIVASLATLAALALLAALLTYWTWIWFAPSPQPLAPAVAQRAVALEPAYALFGGATPDAQPTGLAFELLGVAADSGGHPGYAVLRIGAGRVVAAREGDELEPGVRLSDVQPDHVVLERAGARETLTFPRNRK